MKVIVGAIKDSQRRISKIHVPEFSKRKGRLIPNPKFKWYKQLVGVKPHRLKIVEVEKHGESEMF